MKIKNLILNSVLATVLLSSSAIAQEEADTSSSLLPEWTNNMYVGAGMGYAFSFTDIKQYQLAPVFRHRHEIGYGFNGIIGYKLNEFFSVEGNLAWSRLQGTNRRIPAWFTSSVLQWNADVRFNITNYLSKSTIESRFFDIYLLGGVGLSKFRSSARVLKAGNSNDPAFAIEGWTDLSLTDKASRTGEASAMLGLAGSYRLNDKFDITLEFKGFALNSDKLDAYAPSGSNANDRYTTSMAGVVYHIGSANSHRKLDENDPVAKLDSILSNFDDDDADGVPNYQDKDLNTPAGVKVYPDGTAIDTDGDGVADYKDQEKISPCKDVNANGVANDSDNDGVANCNDLEANTAAGAQVDGNGKTIKTSSAVPTATATAAAQSAESTDNGAGQISGLPSVFFASNSSSVSYKNYNSLTQVAQFLKAIPTAKLIIAGNSDKSGNSAYNKKLAQKRAQAVVDHLVKNNGIDASRLTIVNNGSDKTISTKRNSGQDRRVDFLLTK